MNIDERLIYLVGRNTEPTRRFKELETKTKISANRWQSMWHKRQRPMPDMIEACALLWPQYAFWLVTGFPDSEFGHVAPGDAGYPSSTDEQPNSTKYFEALRDSYIAAKKIGELACLEELGPDLVHFAETMVDLFARNALQLGFPDELTKQLREERQRLVKTAKLRRAELLLNNEMPKIGYPQTEALTQTIEAILNKVPADEQELMRQQLNSAVERLRKYEAREI